MFVVLAEQVHGNEDIVHVAEHQGIFLGIAVLLFKEGDRVVSPMAARVEVVGRVVSIIERESVTLGFISGPPAIGSLNHLTGTSIKVILDR